MITIGFKSFETERRVKTIRSTNTLRQSDQTIAHLARHWFPANPVLLKGIREKLRDGAYLNKRDELLEEIKQDPGLFTFCARSLKNFSDDLNVGIDPLQELKKLEDAKLMNMFEHTSSEISGHQFKSMNKHQALRLQHSLISAHTAEAVARQVELPDNLAFSSSTFRQLGLNMVAWNYPSIYAKALLHEREKPGRLEQELTRLLVLSPNRIAAHFAAEWGMAPEIKHVLLPQHAPQNEESPAGVGEFSLNLQSVCELSELYAQVKDPINYPQAEKQWTLLEPFVGKAVDLSVFAKTADRIYNILTTTELNDTQIRSLPLLEEYRDSGDEGVSRSEMLYQANQHVQRCPEPTREMFHNVYRRIETAKISLEAIKLLVDQVIPELGFKRGCLFLSQKGTFDLIPTLRIGDRPLSNYAAFLSDNNNGINFAMQGSIPVMREATGVTGVRAAQITGAFGNPKHPGVLYLELSAQMTRAADNKAIPLFQAVRKTLIDCMTGA